MGNTPSMPSSVEAQASSKRSAHRLSKPRTGSPATAGLLSNGFSNSTSRFSSSRMSSQASPSSPIVSPTPGTAPPTASLDGSGRNTKESAIDKPGTGPSVEHKESKRRSLFRSISSQRTTSQPNRRNSSVGPSPRATVTDKVVRANSMTYESTQAHVAFYAPSIPEHSRVPLGSRRTSWNYDMCSYEAKRLLNLVEESALEQTTTGSERMTVVSESTFKSSNPTYTNQPAADSPISRANSDLSLYTPMRRRSILQTPGVATRTRASPAPSRHRAPSVRHSHPPTPSMSRQPSHESLRGGVLSMPPQMMGSDFMPRVVTPCEEEYLSIGAFKLGSLRIMNGAASPGSPDIEQSKKNGEPHMGAMRERTDYFLDTPTVRHGETGGGLGDETRVIVAPQPRARNLSPIAASFQEVEVQERAAADALDHEKSAEYLARISCSPSPLDEPAPLSPELQTTSKHMALDDHLFEDDGNVEYSSVEVLDVRLDPNAKSQFGSQQDMQVNKRSMTRTDSGFVSAGSPSEDLPPQTLAKADSGYSSNISLRSFHASKSRVAGEEQLSTSGSAADQPSQSPTKGPPPNAAQLSNDELPPPVPPKDHGRLSSTVQSSETSGLTKKLSPVPDEPSLSSPTSSNNSGHAPSPVNVKHSNEPVPRSPESGARSPLNARSGTSTSALSIGSGSNKPNKLQRLLSSHRRPAHGPPTAHATHSFDKTPIPSIPQDVETKLHQHTGMFPFTSKRLALKPKASKDTLKTIFSVGSMEIKFGVENAAASADDGLRDDQSRGGQLVHAVHSSLANAAAHIIPRKSVARKEVLVRQTRVEERKMEAFLEVDSEMVSPAEAEPISYNWTNTSLGHNAYDVAVVALAEDSFAHPSQATAGRAMSMTAAVERKTYISGGTRPSTSYQPEQQGILLPPPLLPRSKSRETVVLKKTRTPPPVSMQTRSKGSLRVPAPLRHKSSGSSLSRKSSRESVHSYPSYQQPGAQSLAKQSSRENIHSYPSYQQGPHPIYNDIAVLPPPIPPYDPRRSFSLTDRDRQAAAAFHYRAQNSAPQQNLALSRRSSISSIKKGGRSNSLSTSHVQEGLRLQRPSSTQPHLGHPNQSQKLRHRASYDSFTTSNLHSHPPSMSNGYTAPVKPHIDHQWNPQPGFPQRHQDPYGAYPPHVPRGHFRNRSMGNRGYPVNMPYRILHSYNSPAYRNAPIWG